jgi:hypothetical protein
VVNMTRWRLGRHPALTAERGTPRAGVVVR